MPLRSWRSLPRIFWIWLLSTLLPAALLWLIIGITPGDGVAGRLHDFGSDGLCITQINAKQHFLQTGDCVLAINNLPLEQALSWFTARPQPHSQILHYTVRCNGKELTIPGFVHIPSFSETIALHWGTFLLALLNLFLGGYVLLAHPEHPGHRTLAWMLSGIFLQGVGDMFNFQPALVYWGWPFWYHFLYEEGSFLLASLGLVLFPFTFPTPWPPSQRLRRLLYGCFLLLPLSALGISFALAPQRTLALRWGDEAMLYTLSAEALLATGAAWWRHRHAGTPQLHRQTFWLAIHTSLLFFIVGSLLILSRNTTHPRTLTALLQAQLFLPLSIAFGLFYRALQFERWMIGSMASTLTTGGFSFLLALVLHLTYSHTQRPLLVIVLASFLFLIYNPVLKGIQHWLERTFVTSNSHLALLHQTAQSIAHARTLDELDRHLRQAMERLFPKSRVALYLLTGYTLHHSQPPLGHPDTPERIPLRAYQATQLRRGHMLLLHTPLKALVIPTPRPPETSTRIVGALLITPPPPIHTWPSEDQEALLVLTRQIGLVWYLAQTLEERTRSLQKEMELLHNTVITLAQALGYRDNYTESHSQAMVELAEAVGRALGLPEERLRDLRWATLLHDIGKIAIPDRVLNKPTALNDEERHLIRQHPALGAALIQRIPGMERVAEIVRSHHERFDGRGYPRGLKGEQIPIEARIIAVVDAFHAITEDRIYRPGRSMALAVREIERHAGWQFDPQVVAALKQVLRQRVREDFTSAARSSSLGGQGTSPKGSA